VRHWQTVLFVVAVAVAVGALFVVPRWTGSIPAPVASASGSASGGASALPAPIGLPAPPATGGDTAVEVQESDAGAMLPGGKPAPPLDATAPKSVTFGVIVVSYKGAQLAGQSSRTRDDAEKLAKQIAVEAKKDFKAALAKGDKESLENAGRMPRGMLEAAPEYVLFSLAKGDVSEPVDTPRGFWILKRIE